MSQQNVEIVKRGWEAWIGGDFNGLFAIFDPEVVWDTSSFEGWPDEDAYYGHEGVRLFLEQWLGSWERYEAGVEEYLDIDDHRVLVLCWQRGLGARSHVPVEMDWAQLCTLRRGRVCRLENYSDRDEALEAVGLRE